MNKLYLFMSEEDKSLVAANYEQDKDLLKLEQIDASTREQLNTVFGKPMLITMALSNDTDQAAAIKEKLGLTKDEDIFAFLSQLPKQQLDVMLDSMSSNIENMSDSIKTQPTIAYVKAEQVAQGIEFEQEQQVIKQKAAR
ncbi:hypothetical protein CG709_12765, partial [Lachnotalea glycerini]